MASDIWKAAFNRRDFLRGSAALGLGGAAAYLAACGTGTPTAVAPVATPHYPKAQIDGDLEFFNWNQYLDPATIKKLVDTPFNLAAHQSKQKPDDSARADSSCQKTQAPRDISAEKNKERDYHAKQRHKNSGS